MKKSLLIALSAFALIGLASPAFADDDHGGSFRGASAYSTSTSGVVGGSFAGAGPGYGESGALASNEVGAFNESGARASTCGCGHSATVETYSESGQASISSAATLNNGIAGGLGGGFAGGDSWGNAYDTSWSGGHDD